MGEPGMNHIAAGWRILIVSPNRRAMSDLVPLLAQHLPNASRAEVPEYPNRRDLVEIFKATSPNLCFLDTMTKLDAALTVMTDLLNLEPTLKIVVLLGENDPDLILRCLRQGAAEFLVQPFSSDQFQPAMERLNKLAADSGHNVDLGRVYCVMPAKGACGASTVAANLAVQWKRLGAKRVLLADLDPLTGTISFLLKLKSNYSFVDAISHAPTMDADLWKGLVTTVQGIDVLLPPEAHTDGIHDIRDASPILNYARQMYDRIVIDAGSLYGDWSMSMANLCDELLLVTTNELPALQAAQRGLMYLDQNRINRSKLRILINRFSRDLGLSKEMIETALKCEVYHLIPSDYEAIQRALLEGKLAPASCLFGKSMIALSNRLAGRDDAVPKKSSGLGGLFSFLSRS
jgi:pilus assembly protein CpaE